MPGSANPVKKLIVVLVALTTATILYRFVLGYAGAEIGLRGSWTVSLILAVATFIVAFILYRRL